MSNLSKRYYIANGVPLMAVNRSTFQVKKGEIFGLLGPNGAGKSSTFDILSLKLQRTHGQVRLGGIDLDEMEDYRNRGHISSVAQTNTLWDYLTVDQHLQFMGELRGLSFEDIEF